jgi:hypothetical protein
MVTDLELREIILGHFITLLHLYNKDHWLEMEIVQAIERLNLRDGRLVKALEHCLHQGLSNKTISFYVILFFLYY